MVDTTHSSTDGSKSTTILEVVDASESEHHWQSLLAHFIDPVRSHSLGTDALSAFLSVVSDTDETTFDAGDESVDLTDVNVATEQHVPDVDLPDSSEGRVDLLVWVPAEWLLCLELKVVSSETANQTVKYANASKIGDVDIDGFRGSVDYLYVKPRKKLTSPTADEFTTVEWRDICDQLSTIVTKYDGRYPSKSHAYLDDFVTHVTEWGRIPTSPPLEGYTNYEELLDEADYIIESDWITTHFRPLQQTLCEELTGSFFSTSTFDSSNWYYRSHSDNINVTYSKNEWRGIDCIESSCTNPECSSLIEFEIDLQKIRYPDKFIRVRLDIENHYGCEQHRDTVIQDLFSTFRDAGFYNETSMKTHYPDFSTDSAGWNVMPDHRDAADYCWLFTDVDFDFTNPENTVVNVVDIIHELCSEYGDCIDALVDAYSHS